MIKDYISARQNVVQAPAAELNGKLQAIADVFGTTWLEAMEGVHPLQTVWRRVDALATNELLNFGDAIERLNTEAHDWLKGQVMMIKTGDPGQSAGAIFEILALNLFSRQNCRVEQAPASMAGFDGTLHLADGAEVFVSIKNHGMSKPEQQFRADAAALDDHFRARIAANGQRDLELTVLASQHLDPGQFKTLRGEVDECLARFASDRMEGSLVGPYAVKLQDMSGQYGTLSRFEPSSGCRIMSPFSRNEQVNFEDAIRKGCQNLYQHTRSQTGDICRMIVLRLSNTASIAKCEKWAEWFFTEYPNDPVDVIVLYQAAVTDSADTSSITHYLHPITGPGFERWQQRGGGPKRHLPAMRLLVGSITQHQPSMLLFGDNGDAIDLSDHYISQRVDAYQSVEMIAGAEGNLSNPAPGVMIHTVLEQSGIHVRTLSAKMGREKSLALLP